MILHSTTDLYMNILKKKLINYIEKFDRYSPHPFLFPWKMSRKEKEMFDQLIKNSKYYLEFGTGGSTIRALQKSKAKVYSVESSQAWIDTISRYKIINFFRKKRLTLFYVNIGKTKNWGYPADESLRHLYPDYSAKVFETINKEKLDTVFVDGRFRVACVLSTIINVYPSTRVRIIIHDFWSRSHYHDILKYLDEIESVDDLAVFSLKEKIDLEKVRQDYKKFKLVPY